MTRDEVHPPGDEADTSFRAHADAVFRRIRATGITRARNGDVAGVCAGIAQHYGWKDWHVQLGFLVLGFGLFGIGLLAYGLAWMLLPDHSGEIQAEKALRGSFSGAFVGAAIMILLGLPSNSSDVPIGSGKHLPVLTIVGLALAGYLLVRVATGSTAPLLPRRHDAGDSDDGSAAAGGGGEMGGSHAAAPSIGQVGTVSLTKTYAPPTPTMTTPVPPPSPSKQGPSLAEPKLAEPKLAGPVPAGPVQLRAVQVERRTPGARFTLGALAVAALAGLAAFLTGQALSLASPAAVKVGAGSAAVVIGVAVVVAGMRARRAGTVLVLSGALLAGTSLSSAGIEALRELEAPAREVQLVSLTSIEDKAIQTDIADVTLDLSRIPAAATGSATLKLQSGIGDIVVKYPSDLRIDTDIQAGIGDVVGAPREGRLGPDGGPAQFTVDGQTGVGDIVFQEVSR